MMTAPDVSLEAKLSFLGRPGSYPGTVARVQAIETHMSWVFLTEGQAYKLKKPVRYGEIDFTGIAARKYYCEEELRLNRRLAPRVYEVVVPLVIGLDGLLHLDGPSDAVDWLVRMRRLPEQHMLDREITAGTVTDADIEAIASALAHFYREAPPYPAVPSDYCAHLAATMDSDWQTLSLPEYGLPLGAVAAIYSALRAALDRFTDVLRQRVLAGKIVEGHGDLRAEHVCLRPELAIIDCLEFSRHLRMADAADEPAFLALECERLGAVDLGKRMLGRYLQLAGDAPPPGLTDFYQACRACTRAALAIRHLNEGKYRLSAEWEQRALACLALAQRHLSLIPALSQGLAQGR